MYKLKLQLQSPLRKSPKKSVGASGTTLIVNHDVPFHFFIASNNKLRLNLFKAKKLKHIKKQHLNINQHDKN